MSYFALCRGCKKDQVLRSGFTDRKCAFMHFLPPDNEEAVSSGDALAGEYAFLALPFATVHQTKGNFGTVITQSTGSNDFTIWKHDFFIRKPVLLYPYVPEGVHTINYMLKGNIPCELVGFGNVDLREQTYNLYYVPPVKQHAWFQQGVYSCLHIDLALHYLEELATEFSALRKLLDFSLQGNASVVQQADYPIDHNVRLLLKDILQCKETGIGRNIYFRSRIYDLLLVFSRELGRAEKPVFKVDEALLEEIRSYLAANYQEPVTIGELARRFGISQASLTRNFKARFDISVHQFLIRERMNASLTLLKEQVPVQQVAQQIGYADIFSFTKAFTAYFGKSPTAFRNYDGESVASEQK